MIFIPALPVSLRGVRDSILWSLGEKWLGCHELSLTSFSHVTLAHHRHVLLIMFLKDTPAFISPKQEKLPDGGHCLDSCTWSIPGASRGRVQNVSFKG